MEWNIVNNKDIEECMDCGDIATGHAIMTVGMFLKKIANNDGNEIDFNDIEIEKMVTLTEHPEDTKCNLEMELAIVDQVRKIGKALLAAADIRESSNQRIINGLNELIDRK